MNCFLLVYPNVLVIQVPLTLRLDSMQREVTDYTVIAPSGGGFLQLLAYYS